MTKKLATDKDIAGRREMLAGVMAKINERAEKTVIATADQALNPYVVRRPTGVMTFDILLKGGFPPGITYLSGPDNSGKSHLMYRAMAMHQRLYGHRSRIALASAEMPMDHFFLRFMGVMVAVPDLVIEQANEARKANGLPSFTKEEVKHFKYQIGDFTPLAGTMEDVTDAILDLLDHPKLRQTDNQFGIIGVDSWTALCPKDTLGRSQEDDNRQAAHATLTTNFYNKLGPKLTSLDGDPIYTSFLMAQQVRANRDKATAGPMAKYMQDWKTAGAWSAKHAKALDLQVTGGQRIKEESALGGKGAKDVVGKMLKVLVAKGKAGVHDGLTAEVEMNFETPTFIDESANIVYEGIRANLIEETKSGRGKATLSYVNPLTQEAVTGAPYAEFCERLSTDHEFDMAWRRAILAKHNVSCLFTP